MRRLPLPGVTRSATCQNRLFREPGKAIGSVVNEGSGRQPRRSKCNGIRLPIRRNWICRNNNLCTCRPLLATSQIPGNLEGIRYQREVWTGTQDCGSRHIMTIRSIVEKIVAAARRLCLRCAPRAACVERLQTIPSSPGLAWPIFRPGRCQPTNRGSRTRPAVPRSTAEAHSSFGILVRFSRVRRQRAIAFRLWCQGCDEAIVISKGDGSARLVLAGSGVRRDGGRDRIPARLPPGRPRSRGAR